MGWLSSKGRRWPREAATFAQVVVITREMLQREPLETSGYAGATEAIKVRHLALGFQYDNTQIHRAIAALTDPARRPRRDSNRSDRSASRRPPSVAATGSAWPTPFATSSRNPISPPPSSNAARRRVGDMGSA